MCVYVKLSPLKQFLTIDLKIYCFKPFSCSHMLSPAQLFVTPWTVAHQAPLLMGIFRQDY